ncbi:MAG: hypothetical protein IJ648_05365 [Lachnospiraceae bacterium]|nr:hypothetical protein [Lachnospiraceae bacterium]
MDKGTKIYQEIIDELVKKSRNCIYADWAINGRAKGTGEHIAKLNELFAKLTPNDRETLAQYALDAYMSGIYDTLCQLEWYIDCKDMKITVEGEELPTKKFEGLGNDFIGRRDDWEWTEY